MIADPAADVPARILIGGSGTDTVRVMGDEGGDPVVIDLQAGAATSGQTWGVTSPERGAV